MSDLAPINPEVLVWARTSMNLGIDEVVEKFGRKRVTEEVVCAWEAGEGQPTYRQLERLAYEIYKRPLAVFFFPEPPEEALPAESFRSLTPEIVASLSPRMHYLLRRAKALQFSIADLAGGRGASECFLPRELRLGTGRSVAEAAAEARRHLDVGLDQQFGWPDMRTALEGWRDRVEDCGIFVFKDNFQDDEISGFCLHHEVFPLIYLNNNKPKSRQIFTLFHELAHILQETGGVDFRDDRYLANLPQGDRAVEVSCNRFAAELLVPDRDFRERTRRLGVADIEDAIEGLAERYGVSREVILRRFRDARRVDQGFYERKVKEWGRESPRRAAGGGGNWHATHSTYMSTAFLKLAFHRYANGRITVDQLSDHIGVKVARTGRFEEVFLRSLGQPA